MAARFDWDVLAWALMPNHFHLVVRTTQPQLSNGMQRLNGLYAMRFNRRHDRVGHLFQGRFAAWVLDRDHHFENTLAYVLDNPFRAGLRAWRWVGRALRRQLSRFRSLSARWFQGTRWVVPAAPNWSRLARYQSYVSINVCAFESVGCQPSSRSAFSVETNESLCAVL